MTKARRRFPTNLRYPPTLHPPLTRCSCGTKATVAVLWPSVGFLERTRITTTTRERDTHTHARARTNARTHTHNCRETKSEGERGRASEREWERKRCGQRTKDQIDIVVGWGTGAGDWTSVIVDGRVRGCVCACAWPCFCVRGCVCVRACVWCVSVRVCVRACIYYLGPSTSIE